MNIRLCDRVEHRSTLITNIKNMKSLGETIKYLRMSKGMSLTDVAQRTGVGKSFISLIENDERKPSPEVLERIADAIDVPGSFLKEVGFAQRPSEENRELSDVFKELAKVEGKLDRVIDKLRRRKAPS